ncbi:MAG: metallophosphoesterase [Elusimicrobiota bacterium]
MIGVIADTHDNMDAIQSAVQVFNENNVELVLHAGDYVSPFTAKPFKQLNGSMRGVFGNNDGDPVTLKKYYQGIAEIEPGWIKINFKGKNIYLTHRPLPDIPSDSHLYIYGHTHQIIKKEGQRIILNPGECSGWLTNKKTIGLVDLEKMETGIIEI